MMKSILVVNLVLCFAFASCDWAKDTAKDTLHKGGEIAGKAGSEVIDGVASGVEESFSNLIEISPELEQNGIKVGRVNVVGTDSTTDNVVTAYLIFDKDFNGKLTAKAMDTGGKEFGRVKVEITAASGDAKYVDFVFDERTNIDRSDRVRLE